MLGTAGEGGEARSVVRVRGRGGARRHPGRGLPTCGRLAGETRRRVTKSQGRSGWLARSG